MNLTKQQASYQFKNNFSADADATSILSYLPIAPPQDRVDLSGCAIGEHHPAICFPFQSNVEYISICWHTAHIIVLARIPLRSVLSVSLLIQRTVSYRFRGPIMTYHFLT